MIDRAIKLWFFSALVWLVIGPAIGAFQSLQFIAPDWMNFLSAIALPYSKLRIVHTNTVILGWIVMTFISAALFMVPRLCNTPLRFPQLAYAAGWIWNAALVLDLVLIWAAIPDSFWLSIQAGEYAEAPLLVDVMIVAAVVCVIASLHLTVFARERPHLYVSVWYLLGGLYTTAITYLVGNFLVLAFSGEGYQVIEAWWLHNAVGMIITPLGLGTAYYIVPLAAQQPLYSHRLSIVGFWTLMAFYPGTGLHHFLQMPVPIWINEFAVISSVLLGIPVLAVVTNFLATPRGNWSRAFDSYPLRFAALGTLYYLATCLQGPFQATAAVNWYVHFTEWVQAHAHLALAGAFTCYGMAAGYYMFPRITGRQLYSRGLASVTFWCMVIFFPIFYIGFTWSGVATGASINLMGNTIYQTINITWIPRLSRTITGTVVVVGFIAYVWLLLRSLRVGAPYESGMNEVPEMGIETPFEEARA
ncbi:hypothetical protein SAOR_08845 [Salinisphaera orenii MK-B5]|uniref:Cytochrome oxidase subunit I profile domain-containing protein n=1 Tax=Salinisphaera orenii MK-B5 TaxID=856730 RepID=A0A423PNV1_9GAMM|nr:cbb3-type cytochrome c oxidase subunit I [Salinisphaera orenii]ROO27296.1 hypothetical protein SAOR_08845 [Salinisphaera orenii MK-B5]